ncbi:unnamed protein product [Nyctereutes procyonoides]|uniref:(raccoon dog) hypothetical protein n=1 Tax=Nyctereutes procyonoides TaxID=34880 RepID=A0A811XZ88_NYCPR|nr:unnamed protein product [Nyctereutes procyonoides]
MCLPRTFLLLCLPGYFTLSLCRILRGTVGGMMVMECQYNVREEGHRKEHLSHVIMEELEEGDADTYWHGLDRATSVPLSLCLDGDRFSRVTCDLLCRLSYSSWTTETLASMGAPALTSHMASPAFLPGKKSQIPAGGSHCPGFIVLWSFLLFVSFFFLVLLKAILFLNCYLVGLVSTSSLMAMVCLA